ncbi:MAG: alginate lyase family protein [Desulfomonilaceae bacterium]
MIFHKMLRRLRTSRHLRLSQVAWRLRYLLERKLPVRSTSRYQSTQVKLRPDFPSIPLAKSHESGNEVADGLARGRLQLLNREEHFGREDIDWRLGPRASQRLWTITLHYHEWLYPLAEIAASGTEKAQEAFRLFERFVSDWLAHCDLERPGARDLAWNSYAISTRITWWIRSHRVIPRTVWDQAPEFERVFLDSLWKQAAYLHDHPEYDLLGNHLLRDAVGLAWAGRFFDAPEARQWLRTATQIALLQAEAQVLPDGGHIERSPMYHLEVMGDFLSLGLLLEDEAARSVMRNAWERMAECSVWLRHPDSKIPLLNDAALNGSCTPDVMASQGTGLAWSVDNYPKSGGKLFPDLGLFVWHGDPWNIFFDVGPIGVDYQPGHGHADTLTIEASYRGQRFWVDPGTWAYDLDDRRRYDRSTAAHNTVCVDERDSSEVWHIFRCGRRAYPTDVQVKLEDGGFAVSAGHDGYRHLSGSPIPRRDVTLRPDQRLVITDRCDGHGTHLLSGGWLLAPGWSVSPCDGGWRVSHPDSGDLMVHISGPSGLTLHESLRWYHPEFGKELVTTRLEWSVQTSLPAEIMTIQEPE